jgi:D-xylulose reductase
VLNLYPQVHFWTNGGIGDKVVSEDQPLVMGHEASGTIHAVGTGVEGLKPGDRVAIEPMRPCRVCIRCKEGQYNLCPLLEFAASPPNISGTLSKFYCAPADFCHKLSSSTSLEQGIFAEPLAVAVHAVRMVGVSPGDRVIVFGAGTIGILSIAVSQFFGAKQVIVVEINEERLGLVHELTKAATFIPNISHPPVDNASKLKQVTGLVLGADAVIETSGAESSINIAIHALRYGGQMVQTGLGRSMAHIPIVEITEKEIHLHGAARYGAGDFAIAMDILGSGFFPVERLIASVFPFESATQAWNATKRGEGIKNIIRGVEN